MMVVIDFDVIGFSFFDSLNVYAAQLNVLKVCLNNLSGALASISLRFRD